MTIESQINKKVQESGAERKVTDDVLESKKKIIIARQCENILDEIEYAKKNLNALIFVAKNIQEGKSWDLNYLTEKAKKVMTTGQSILEYGESISQVERS